MRASARPSRAPQAFLLALAAGILIFLPFVIYDGGYFIYYGDFNVQQIPFYKLAHEAVRGGDIFWNWHTDLGVNFIGSYSFYLLFSPFFWLTLPFPTEWVPFLMAPLLVLKTACAALTSFLYLRRFVRDQRFAVIGSLLYAFSGWMIFNIFFNHFHEVAVFFPLLLLGVEQLVTENKRGLLAFAVFINAAVNYWFFAGEAIFVILYVIVRATDRSWGLTLRRFCLIALEAVLGFAAAAAVVLPSVLALLGNPRTGTDELLSGWRLWLYWHEQRQPAVVQSLFFPPELPARPNFLPDHGAKWASLSGWLPLLSLTGVLAYFFGRRGDWLKKLLALCLVFALVPGLNSLFILLNDSYYARWYYMPLLLMAMASARAIEDSWATTAHFWRACKWTFIVLAVYTVMCGLTPTFDEDGVTWGLAADPTLMWIYAGVAFVCLALTALLVLRLRHRSGFPRMLLAGVLAVTVGFTVFFLANGKITRARSEWLIDHAIEGREKISLPHEATFSRIDVYDSTDNLGMFWHRPTIQAFHSIVPPSIMEFYPQVGVTRDVASRPDAELYALRSLLSVRWLFIEDTNEQQQPMPGYHFYDNQNGFHIYENDNFLPLGFTYDAYVTPRLMEDVDIDLRGNLMLRAVVLDEGAAARNDDILQPLEDDGYLGFTEETMAADVESRRLFAADSVTIDRRGFTVTTDFEGTRLLFVSVPHEAGWSARLLGGGRLRIEQANLGFMAVRVPPGAQAVRFDYETPGLTTGLVITASALLMLLGYLLLSLRFREKPAPAADVADEIMQGKTIHLSWEEYRAIMGDKQARADHLQRTLNEAAARHIEDTIRPEDRTLHFTPTEETLEEMPPQDSGADAPGDNQADSGNTTGESPDENERTHRAPDPE